MPSDKDSDRNDLFLHVQKTLQFTGKPLRDGSDILGDWIYRYHFEHPPQNAHPDVSQSFKPDGSAPSRALDGSFAHPKDRWVLNDDGTLSIWFHIDPMPEYGIDNPTYSEERHNALMDGADRLVLFNSDASLITVYERAV